MMLYVDSFDPTRKDIGMKAKTDLSSEHSMTKAGYPFGMKNGLYSLALRSTI